jgi:hypothetical protein
MENASALNSPVIGVVVLREVLVFMVLLPPADAGVL